MIYFDIYNEKLLENPKLSGYNTKKKEIKWFAFDFAVVMKQKKKRKRIKWTEEIKWQFINSIYY